MVLTAKESNRLPDDNDEAKINGETNPFERTQELQLAA